MAFDKENFFASWCGERMIVGKGCERSGWNADTLYYSPEFEDFLDCVKERVPSSIFWETGYDAEDEEAIEIEYDYSKLTGEELQRINQMSSLQYVLQSKIKSFVEEHKDTEDPLIRRAVNSFVKSTKTDPSRNFIYKMNTLKGMDLLELSREDFTSLVRSVLRKDDVIIVFTRLMENWDCPDFNIRDRVYDRLFWLYQVDETFRDMVLDKLIEAVKNDPNFSSRSLALRYISKMSDGSLRNTVEGIKIYFKLAKSMKPEKFKTLLADFIYDLAYFYENLKKVELMIYSPDKWDTKE